MRPTVPLTMPPTKPAAVTAAELSRVELSELPAHVPAWPGQQRGEVFVRRGRGAAVDREPALLVHGLGGSSLNWTDLIWLLGDRLDCEAVDLPGFGHSPPSRHGHGLRTHIRAVIRRIEERGDGPVHLVGNSLGGAVCTVVATSRPDLVRTLTLVSPALPTLRPARGADRRLPLLALPGVSRVAGRALRRTSAEQRVQGVVDLCFADPRRLSDDRRAEMVEEARRRAALGYDGDVFTGALRGLVKTYALRGDTGMWRRLSRVQVPGLVVWGREDRLVSAALAPRVARTLPDGRLLLLDGVGHVAQLEAPEVVARALLALVDDQVDSPADDRSG